MRAPTNYGGEHVGHWKEGQYTTVKKVLAVVWYDQKYDAYIIDYEDVSEFLEWVCHEWFESYDDNEEPIEFLLHNDADVKFINLGELIWER
jgi:hypothetical protein